jgi:cyclopropane-fatty-acyl-phospholipid synthase
VTINSTLPSSAITYTPLTWCPVDRGARALVIRRLKSLQGGVVSLIEQTGTQRLGGGDGDDPLAATLHVTHPRFYRRIATAGALGAAESYLDGDWHSPDLTILLRLLARNLNTADRLRGPLAWFSDLAALLYHKLRANTLDGSRANIHAHYDLGNDFFALFLDETMNYSCGIFEHEGATLRDASIAKMDRLCRKLDLKPEDHLLEIGTGWGGLAIHAAERYGCRVTTTTISRQQHDLATQRIAQAGLAHRVTVLLEDYRRLRGQYDKLVSVEMIEAVGHEFLPDYFAACCRLLKPTGLSAIQAINMNDQRYARYRRRVDFIQRYVFPGSCCPSLEAMIGAIRKASDFRMVHVEDIGPHYATTLRQWRLRFLARLDEVRALGCDDRFIRLWEYYLCYCEAGFAERYIGDVQLVLARPQCRRAPILGDLGGALAERAPA